MVLLLSSVLELPLRERNGLLQAAGYASAYRETGLSEPGMAEMVDALRLIVGRQEPFPARVVDRHWDLVMVNPAYLRVLEGTFGTPCNLVAYEILPSPRINVLRVLFDPNGVRPHVANWDEVARDVLARVRREAAFEGDGETEALLGDLVRMAGFPASPRHLSEGPQALLIPVEIRAGAHLLRFFTTITTMGAAQDITLAELRIEAFHPADASTAAFAEALAADRG
jgi:hypothetical protein